MAKLYEHRKYQHNCLISEDVGYEFRDKSFDSYPASMTVPLRKNEPVKKVFLIIRG